MSNNDAIKNAMSVLNNLCTPSDKSLRELCVSLSDKDVKGLLKCYVNKQLYSESLLSSQQNKIKDQGMVDNLVLQVISHCIVNAKRVKGLEQHLITQSKVYEKMKAKLSSENAPKNKDGTIKIDFKDLNNFKILYTLHKKENYQYRYNDYRPIGLYNYVLDKFELDIPFLKSYMELNNEKFVSLYKECENIN